MIHIMSKNIEQGERQTTRLRPSRGRRILAGLGVASVLAGGLVEAHDAAADQLAASIAAINASTDASGLQPAVRLNPPKPRLGNHEAYMIGDSLTVGLSQTDTKQYAANLGWDITFNGKVSRALYLGCDQPHPYSACATLSDGITQINQNAEIIAKKCTFIMWLGTNPPESDQVYAQKYAQAYNKVIRIWDEDPAQTCPTGQRRFMAVNMSHGPRATSSFVQQMGIRNQIIQDTIGPLFGAAILDMEGFVTANGLLNSSPDGIHATSSSAQIEGHYLVDTLNAW